MMFVRLDRWLALQRKEKQKKGCTGSDQHKRVGMWGPCGGEFVCAPYRMGMELACMLGTPLQIKAELTELVFRVLCAVVMRPMPGFRPCILAFDFYKVNLADCDNVLIAILLSELGVSSPLICGAGFNRYPSLHMVSLAACAPVWYHYGISVVLVSAWCSLLPVLQYKYRQAVAAHLHRRAHLFLLWCAAFALADTISELKLGNGTSVLIFANIASALPSSVSFAPVVQIFLQR
eukprot:1157497-Pelagomonas_calceolata.AAC.8